MKFLAPAAALAFLACVNVAGAAELSKSYSYFSIRGNTLDDIEGELNRRGPNVAATGKRHPGATRMEFNTKLTYANRGRSCAISAARVRVIAKVILPRWKPGKRAPADTRFVWGTLSSDIKRHEEQHVQIAKNHARELEQALMKIGSQKTCKIASDKAASISKRLLDAHDHDQQRFDRVETKNFEKRLLMLMQYRMKRMAG